MYTKINWHIYGTIIKKLISRIFHYQARETIIYIINNYIKVILDLFGQKNNNNCSIKLLNFFGLIITSISLENGIFYVSNSIIHLSDNLKNEIKKWCIDDVKYFWDQSQQWVLGLPGKNTEYNINFYGLLVSFKFFL